MCIFVCAAHWIYLVLGLGLNFGKSFSEQATFVVFYSSLTVSLTITIIFTKIWLKLMNYAMFILVIVRISVTLLNLHFIEQSVDGFELVDKKEMSDVIPFFATPAMILSICNFKFNMILTVPIVFVSTLHVIQRTLSTEFDNLSCYKNPDFYANSMSER